MNMSLPQNVYDSHKEEPLEKTESRDFTSNMIVIAVGKRDNKTAIAE